MSVFARIDVNHTVTRAVATAAALCTTVKCYKRKTIPAQEQAIDPQLRTRSTIKPMWRPWMWRYVDTSTIVYTCSAFFYWKRYSTMPQGNRSLKVWTWSSLASLGEYKCKTMTGACPGLYFWILQHVTHGKRPLELINSPPPSCIDWLCVSIETSPALDSPSCDLEDYKVDVRGDISSNIAETSTVTSYHEFVCCHGIICPTIGYNGLR